VSRFGSSFSLTFASHLEVNASRRLNRGAQCAQCARPELLQTVTSRGMPELFERLFFNLPDSFPRDMKSLGSISSNVSGLDPPSPKRRRRITDSRAASWERSWFISP
jgi:hypothetical protein